MLTIASRLDALNRIGRALADPTRARILLSLLDAPSYPAELAQSLDLTRSNVSNHLACLRDCGIVLAELMPRASEAYASIAPTNNVATAEYKTSLDITPGAAEEPGREFLERRLREAMLDRRKDEMVRGVSLVGPHRDDATLFIGELPAKGYASHGECWSLALALRLGSFHLLRADGIEPVLVLDDVFAELDATRRLRLAESVRGADQVLVTAAVPTDVPELLTTDPKTGEPTGRRFRVRAGTVVPAGVDGEPLEPDPDEDEETKPAPQPVDKRPEAVDKRPEAVDE